MVLALQLFFDPDFLHNYEEYTILSISPSSAKMQRDCPALIEESTRFLKVHRSSERFINNGTTKLFSIKTRDCGAYTS